MNVFRWKRALAPLFGALAMVGLSVADADTFGRTTTGITPSSGLRADFKRGSKYTLAKQGVLRQLCAYVDGRASTANYGGDQRMKVVMYRDSGGVPAVRIAEGEEHKVGKGDAGDWLCSATPDVPLAPGNYWIVIHSGRASAAPPYEAYDGVPIIRYYADGTGNWYGNADAFADGASYQFGAGGTGDGTLSAYARIDAAPSVKTAGRTTIGATPSGPLRTDFKRGSSFTVAEQARLTAISGYFDGLGATSGSQPVTMAVYRDEVGVPGEYVAQTSFTVNAGMPAQWLSSRWLESVQLTPGKYWLVVHTGGQQPVARYYGDGTGNWYGNVDSYANGPSKPFGAGGPGDGTISAFITYETGPFTETILGSQVPGTPRRVLPENYAQGSEMVVIPPNALITGINVFIDGLGGGTGTQRLKLVVMNPTWTDIHASEEKIIPAGAPAQWVTFPVQPFRNDVETAPYPFWVFITSGNNSGVARIYGRPGSGYEISSVRYETRPYYPPFFFDYPRIPNDVTYSFNARVQLAE